MTEARAGWPAIALLLAPLALLPFGVAAEAALLIGAGLGLTAALRRTFDLRAAGARAATLVFLAYWVPELCSAFDAIAPRKSWTEVAVDLRFLPWLWFAVHTLCGEARARRALLGVAGVLAFWCADALLQAATGISLGGPLQGDRLSGIFGDDNLKLGGAIATLAPFGLLLAWQRYGARGAVLAFLPILTVVLLAGARASWIALALVAALVLWRQLGTRRGALALLGTLAVMLIAGVAANALSTRFAERINRTAAALRGDPTELDYALAGRLPIWRTAMRIGGAHPINGVGVRAFRFAYPAFADADDPWVNRATGEGASHAHQLLLELWTETGAIGLLCWSAAAFWLIRAWRRADRAARQRAAAPAYALVAMLFPINTHYAVYSAMWGLFLFVMLGLWLGTLHARSIADPAG